MKEKNENRLRRNRARMGAAKQWARRLHDCGYPRRPAPYYDLNLNPRTASGCRALKSEPVERLETG